MYIRATTIAFYPRKREIVRSMGQRQKKGSEGEKDDTARLQNYYYMLQIITKREYMIFARRFFFHYNKPSSQFSRIGNVYK